MSRRVVVAGWGQVTQRKEHEGELQDPIGLMRSAARRAGVASRLDGIMVVRVMSRHCPAAADQLASALGSAPRLRVVSGIGGSSPQALINQAAGRIARGELDVVLVAGAETYYPRSGAPGAAVSERKAQHALFQGLEGGHEREDMIGSTELEARHGVVLPIHGFPLFETALWAESGLPLPEYMGRLARRWSAMSRVAADHPNAWSRAPVTAEEIAVVAPAGLNRPIAFPYPKLLNPRVSVDLGAAVLLAAEGVLPERGDNLRPVYFLGGAYAEDRQRFLAERSDFVTSPPLQAAARRALRRSGLALDEVEAFDLYSCFPCAPEIARRMIGIAADDRRPTTVTGGLGFFGGPGNNYSLHAVATLAERIARGRHETGMVNGVGWFMHKHSVGLYGARPTSADLAVFELEDRDLHRIVVGEEPVPMAEPARGRGVIETYTVLHARDGEPTTAILYGRMPSGRRFVAHGAGGQEQRDLFDELTTTCQVGREVRLEPDLEQGLTLAFFQ